MYKRDWRRAVAAVCILVKSRIHPPPYFDMKTFVLLTVSLAVALAAPQGGADKDAVIVKSELDNIGVDGFNWAYETSNGISASEQGQLNNAGSENEVLAVRGQFQYVGTDGVTYTVTYIADENGFQPQGAHLPKAP